MPASHKLKIVYDEAAGTVAASHRCTVEVAGVPVGHEREVVLGGDAAAALRAYLDANRTLMEEEATALAIEHVAAVNGKAKKGTTQLKVAGSIGSLGAGDAQKKD